jgi:hypothetical protein
MRAASLGKGNKYDFTTESKNRNTNFYNLGSDFDLEHPHSPKYTFGISRDHVYDGNKNYDKNSPGPGKYNCAKEFGSESYKFTMRGRGEDKLNPNKNKFPGPGDYQTVVQMNPDGKFPISKFKNATKIIFGASKASRFNYSRKILFYTDRK